MKVGLRLVKKEKPVLPYPFPKAPTAGATATLRTCKRVTNRR